MHIGIRAAVTALFFAILLVAPASASATANRRIPAIAKTAPSLDLYSQRARRRARIILELKLLEMRKAHLDRVRQVIEKRIPLDCLFNQP
ncbi:MAG: hypothetical protein M3N19_06990 [Candidatus Eremiobacteraeota bacterium]|nr:hypothetical protein [Candidatus Eremiobacteraeota bacterium]